MRLIVVFGWIDNVVGFHTVVGFVVTRGLVIGRMMMKLVGVCQSNTSGQIQTVSVIPIHIIPSWSSILHDRFLYDLLMLVLPLTTRLPSKLSSIVIILLDIEF